MKYLLYIALLFSISLIPKASYAQGADLFADCSAYPGLVNKVVKCVTRMTSYALIDERLDSLYDNLVGVANAAVVLYISIFGFRMMAGGIQHLRRETFLVLATAVAILTFNNTVGVTQFLNIFLRAQAEFAAAATFAVSTKPPKIENGVVIPDNSSESAICFGPKVKNPAFDNNLPEGPENQVMIPEPGTNGPKAYGIWQRIDCIIGYVIGAHPLVEKTSQYFDPNGQKSGTGALAADNRKFDYDLFASNQNPFADMANDPFCMLSNPPTNANAYDPCANKRIDSKDKRGTTKEQGISFSIFVIAIGMFFEDVQSGGVGLIVMLTSIFIVFLMIAAFGQVMLVYISCMFAIIILSFFAPVVIPCILFRHTKGIFQGWLQMFFGYMLQPGLMLAYLTFMIFVIQYVISYSKPMSVNLQQCLIDGKACSPTAPADNSGCNNPKCDRVGDVCVKETVGESCVACPAECAGFSVEAGFQSLAQMNFGGAYTNGFKDYSDIMREWQDTSTKSSGAKDLSDTQGEYFGTTGTEGMDKNFSDSKTNRTQDEYYKDAKSNVTGVKTISSADLANVAADSDTNSTGSATDTVVAPSFNFAVAECTQWDVGLDNKTFCSEHKKRYVSLPAKLREMIEDKMKAGGLTKLELDEFAQSYQSEGINDLSSLLGGFNEQQINMQSNYMQILLVVFLTLSITISFMHNVMKFAEGITGAGMRPISQMVDIYNMNVSRASRVIRS